MVNQDRCPSFDEVWEELEHGEGGETFVKARKIAEELTKSIEIQHYKNNGIISECSKYPTCRDLWERQERDDGRIMIPFSCKDCVGYECYWHGYNAGSKENKEG